VELYKPLEIHSITKLGKQLSAAEKERERASLQTQARKNAYRELSSSSVQPVASSSRQRIPSEPVRSQSLESTQQTPDNPAPNQTQQIIMAQVAPTVASFRIPSPWDTNAPKFDGKTASSLKRYIRNIRTIFDRGNITDDQDKKERTVEYITDEDIKEQWERLPNFNTGSFEEFIKEIETLFPELEDDKVGSLKKLEKICHDNRDIRMKDLGELRRFITSFTTEADKLLLPPASINNGQLVDMFLECLEETFRLQVNMMMAHHKFWMDKVGTNPLVPVQPLIGPQLIKRRGDKIPLKDVTEIALQVSDTWTGSTVRPRTYTEESSLLPASNSGIKHEMVEKLETLSMEVAQIHDRFEAHKKEIGEKVEVTIQKSFAQHMRQPPPHMNMNNNGGESSNRNNQMNNSGKNNNTNRGSDQGCFYCGLEHLIAECPYKEQHIKMGYLSFDNGHMRLGNGGFIPKFPENKSRKERVDDYYANQGKPRGAPLGTISNQFSQMQYDNGSDQMSSIYDTRNDELLALRVQMMNMRNEGQQASMVTVPTFAAPSQSYQQFSQIVGTAPKESSEDWVKNQWSQFLEEARKTLHNGQFVQTRAGANTQPESKN
jgi:hypothetical protein